MTRGEPIISSAWLLMSNFGFSDLFSYFNKNKNGLMGQFFISLQPFYFLMSTPEQISTDG
jgi:hypothetical protein